MRTNKTYLLLEALEERYTPAGGSTGNIWKDTLRTQQWSDAGNWSQGHVPTNAEDAVFDGNSSSDNCLWAGGNPIPAGLDMVNNFNGTVKLTAAMEVGTDGMDMEAGNISQATAGATLTVDGLLNWVAGNINTSTQQNVVLVNGGGNITGAADRTAGSTLNVSRQVNFRMTGNLTFNNNSGITVQSNGVWGWTGSGNLFTQGQGTVSNGGNFFVNFAGNQGATVTSQLPIENNADGCTLQVSWGTLNDTGLVNGASVYQSGGRTIIDQGSTLGVGAGFTMVDGYLYTNGDRAATINGDVMVSGGYIVLNGLSLTSACGILNITGSGNLTIAGWGEYDAKVDVGNQINDMISASGNVTLGGTSTLSVTTYDIPQGGVPTTTLTILTAGRGSTMSGDFYFQYLNFNGGAWTTEVWNRTGDGRGGYSYLLKYQRPPQ